MLSFLEKEVGSCNAPLTKAKALEKDLGITGDDAIEFLLKFSDKLNIDMSRFDIKLYFEPEGDPILPDGLLDKRGNIKN